KGTASRVMLFGRWLVGLTRLTLFGLTDSCTMPGGIQIPLSPGGGPRLTRPSGQCGVGFAGGGGAPPRRCALGARPTNAPRAPSRRAPRASLLESSRFFAGEAGLLGACSSFSDTLRAEIESAAPDTSSATASLAAAGRRVI